MTVEAQSSELENAGPAHDNLMPEIVEEVPASFDLAKSDSVWTITCRGDWTIAAINDAENALGQVDLEGCPALVADTGRITRFDTAGAWLIERIRLACVARSIEFRQEDWDKRRIELVRVIAQDQRDPVEIKAKQGSFVADMLEHLGRQAAGIAHDMLTACYLIGASVRGTHIKEGRRGKIRFTSIIHHLDQMGLRSIPVIAVMSFLIGAIIAQQGAYQLKYYGEELLMVPLVGILHFREIGVLLTAVMVAGRTGSAITAEIGTMKMREEIDALTVIGLNPVGVLILPRLIALIIALPILVLLSDLAGIAGAILVGEFYVGISPQQFLSELQNGVDISNMYVGFIKAPVMAAIIGLAAAVEGLKVGGSAESLGQRTTAAVVRAIFAVIVVDGLFAMFFSAIGY